MLNRLFNRFENIAVLDIETTGLNYMHDEIIELGVLMLTRNNNMIHMDCETDFLIRLSPGRELPEVITNLTGITGARLEKDGIDKKTACLAAKNILDRENTLLVAYNAQFDLCFLYNFLHGFGVDGVLKKIKMLDALTVFKDRRDYPHRLDDAVAAYKLKIKNTHRAIDDAKTAFELLCAMESELDDLDRYVNIFGYNPKYGVSGLRISSVKYVPQPYTRVKKAYEY